MLSFFVHKKAWLAELDHPEASNVFNPAWLLLYLDYHFVFSFSKILIDDISSGNILIPDEIKNKVDRIWDALHSGGGVNPISVTASTKMLSFK